MSIMRLLPGDLADRQSIVELKINHSNAEFDEEEANPFAAKRTSGAGIARVLINKGAINVAPFLDELDLIRKKLEKEWIPDLQRNNKVEAYDKLYTELEETNSQLWDLEDKIRALKSAPDAYEGQTNWLNVVKDTAFDIVTKNDKRSVLIKQINALWGYTTQEKLY